jgi:hypothetical protein
LIFTFVFGFFNTNINLAGAQSSIYFNSTAPIIYGTSGPQKLNVNQQGTWSVTAYDKNKSTLLYSVYLGR